MWERSIAMALCAASLLAGCLHEASQSCRNGAVCPPGLNCVDTESTTADGRVCVAGTCGNRRVDPGEVCDDGNNRSGDGCPADCSEPCGDSVLDPDEVCDDGNTVDGDGCSADCQLRDGIFLVTPSLVSFAALEGDPLPAAVTVTVRLPSRGILSRVDDSPGAPIPSWLSIAQSFVNANTAELRFQVTDTTRVGERLASVPLMLSEAPGSAAVKVYDLDVIYRVEPRDLAVDAIPAMLAFEVVRRDTAFQSRTVSVAFNGESLALVRAPTWLTVTAPVSVVSPAAFAVTPNNSDFPVGTVLSGEIVFATTKGMAERRVSVRVDYTIAAELAITATPGAMTFTAINGGALPPSQTVDVTFTGARVSCIDAPSWVTVSRRPATTSPASFVVSINTTAFDGGTLHSGLVVFETTSTISPKAAAVRVDYDVRHTPEVQFVAPYLGVPGRGGKLYVRGHGFQAYDRPVTVRIGDLVLQPVNADNDTLVTLTYPPLPAGRYPVTLVDPTAIAPRAPELVIAAPPSFTYQAIDAPGNRRRLVYDPERRALYGMDPDNDRIDHFVYGNGTWSSVPSHAIPRLTDIAMAPDGRSLIVIDSAAINEVSLTDGLFAPVVRAPFPPFICSLLSTGALANNGKMIVFSASTGSGVCPAYYYDMLDHSIAQVDGAFFQFGHIAASGDGSRIYYRTHGDSSAPFKIYDALSNTLTTSFARVAGTFSMTVNGDASRLLLSGPEVFTGSLRLLGNLPNLSFYTMVSQSGSRAFMYREDFMSARIEVYDLDGPLQPGAVFPLLGTVVLPDRPNEQSHFAFAMTSTPDDTVLFVSGADRLLVVPMN